MKLGTLADKLKGVKVGNVVVDDAFIAQAAERNKAREEEAEKAEAERKRLANLAESERRYYEFQKKQKEHEIAVAYNQHLDERDG